MSCDELKQFFDAYKTWVCKNVELVGEFENLLKLASYFVSGKCPQAQWVSELVYSLGNFVTLVNDCLLRIGKGEPFDNKVDLHRNSGWMKVGLAVLEYVEVFLETFAERFLGKRGKWCIVLILQLLRSVWRVALLICGRWRLVVSPAVKPLPRKSKMDYLKPVSCEVSRLRRSNRCLRKLDGAPPASSRSWKPIYSEPVDSGSSVPNLSSKQLTAELIYVVKPLAHLALLFRCGSASWKPWVGSLAMDCVSLALHRQEASRLRGDEKFELISRAVFLLVYLLRSPMYDRCTKTKILSFLAKASAKSRLLRYVCDPVGNYLPEWQKTYFRVWSS
ncbi:unnamed protein product [Notodromas monacha]|uniref:Peroxisomal membrane protein PEX16 n=1 Tax=Notodromas monacha TaxID=399045 RepID=A0A7R9BNQ9_9CRUS|nr:unnamed protein product [Notodromas monacha]CAG0918899.1 unnamed protein product [Notodromas monacha]